MMIRKVILRVFCQVVHRDDIVGDPSTVQPFSNLSEDFLSGICETTLFIFLNSLPRERSRLVIALLDVVAQSATAHKV